MKKDWFFDRYCGQQFVALIEDGKLVEFASEGEDEGEIVGNIYDETDAPEMPDIIEQTPNRWHVAGSTPIEDAEEALGVVLQGEEVTYDTFGGFVIANLAYIPQDGETPEFSYRNLSVKVTAIAEKRIEMTEVVKSDIVEDEASGDGAESDSDK